MVTFADTSAFNAGVKEKNTKTNKITIVKDQKLATQNLYIRVVISYVRKYLLCGFRKININLLYTHHSYNMLK
jgi:hypothetical protein